MAGRPPYPEDAVVRGLHMRWVGRIGVALQGFGVLAALSRSSSALTASRRGESVRHAVRPSAITTWSTRAGWCRSAILPPSAERTFLPRLVDYRGGDRVLHRAETSIQAGHATAGCFRRLGMLAIVGGVVAPLILGFYVGAGNAAGGQRSVFGPVGTAPRSTSQARSRRSWPYGTCLVPPEQRTAHLPGRVLIRRSRGSDALPRAARISAPFGEAPPVAVRGRLGRREQTGQRLRPAFGFPGRHQAVHAPGTLAD